MSVISEQVGNERPYQELPQSKRRGNRAFSEDWWGAFSIENFCDVGALWYTHDDAQGWIQYLERFHPRNFWYTDGNVRPWAYYEQYDNWEDTYGLDACNAVYHSGHGGMDGNGVFYVPMGGDWGGLGCTATSNNMRLGNEQANYIFWSTCTSLRVHDGHTPIRTWAPANLGFRMLFGFETVSIDSPDYGKNFWNRWNQNNNSFSRAWLLASRDIDTHQTPSVVACGATAEEAQNRLWNERFFSWAHASTAWWWWTWWDADRALRETNRALPDQLLIARLEPPAPGERAFSGILDRLNLDLRLPDTLPSSRDNSYTVADGETSIAFGHDGSFTARLGSPNRDNRDQLTQRQAVVRAQESLGRFGFTQDVDLIMDSVRLQGEAGGSDAGSGERSDAFVSGTEVQFRQVINGLPVVTPNLGLVRVELDNDGTVTAVQSSTRAIADLSDRPRNTTSMPPEQRNGQPHPNGNGSVARARAADPGSYERLLSTEWAGRMARWAARGRMPEQFAVVPGTTEVGYDIRGNEAVLVAQRLVEVDFGNGIYKRYRQQTDLLA